MIPTVIYCKNGKQILSILNKSLFQIDNYLWAGYLVQREIDFINIEANRDFIDLIIIRSRHSDLEKILKKSIDILYSDW